MKFFDKFRNHSTRKKVLLTLSTLTLLVATPLAVHAGFFPDRPTFDYNISGNNNCNDPTNPARNNGRCGSLNGPVFDSFVNVPNVGDERSFLDGFRSDQTAAGTHADPVTNVTDGSQEVTFRLYIHNNASTSTNASGLGIAHNTAVRIALPTVEGNALRAVGYISASNAVPQVVQDSLDLTSTKNFTVQYEPGSAKLFNNGPFANGVALSDNIVTSGAPVGYNALNGEFPGCFDFIATVQIKVKIIPKQVPNISLTKQVRITGTQTFASEVAAKPGDDVQFVLNTKNTGLATLTNTITRDVLPPHLKLDPGTVKVTNAGQGTRTLADGPLFSGGFNLGQYNPNDNTLVTFKTTVLDDFEGCSLRVRNVGHAKSDQTPTEVTDDADVVITKQNCTTPATTPVFTCDLLQVTTAANRLATYTVNTTATGGAQVNFYRYDFGDGTTALVTDKNTVQHTYAKDGQFASHVQVGFMVDGQLKTVDSAKCAAAVNFTTPATPTTTPPTATPPTQLVNTGPGSVVAMFAATTIAGTIGYRWLLARRLNRQ